MIVSNFNIMKKAISIISVLVFTTIVFSQEISLDKYRRSSLSMILLETADFPQKEAVMQSWNNYPFPDKYNINEIGIDYFNIDNVTFSEEELINAGYLKDTINGSLQILRAVSQGKSLQYLNDEQTTAIVVPSTEEEFYMKISKFLNDNRIANRIIRSWFVDEATNSFSMNLIQERGFYNASILEANIAQGQIRGIAGLADAGEQLINNSFVTITTLNFYENEPVAALVRDEAKKAAQKNMEGQPQAFLDAAYKTADEVYEKTKEGYSLVSTTLLYRLNWNDSIASVFYEQIWNNIEKLDTSSLFSLELIGVQGNSSLVTFKIGDQRTQEELIDIALVRNLDNVFAKLQKNYDVFKVKVPVASTNPIVAQIGMKEGLEGNEKFDVYEMVFDPDQGVTTYNKVGSIKVDKENIWDNRYSISTDDTNTSPDTNEIIRKGTVFSGNNKIQPGMLIIQVK